MKTITYSASSELGARSLALQDGHTGEPVRKWLAGNDYHLTYPAQSRLAVLWKLRLAQARAHVERIAHRRACDQQSAILRAMR